MLHNQNKISKLFKISKSEPEKVGRGVSKEIILTLLGRSYREQNWFLLYRIMLFH